MEQAKLLKQRIQPLKSVIEKVPQEIPDLEDILKTIMVVSLLKQRKRRDDTNNK